MIWKARVLVNKNTGKAENFENWTDHSDPNYYKFPHPSINFDTGLNIGDNRVWLAVEYDDEEEKDNAS